MNTSIPTKIVTDNRISHIEFRVYSYVRSLPNKSIIHNKDIMERLKISSQQTIANSWKQLLRTGWIKRERSLIVLENGELSNTYKYQALDSPQEV